MEHAHALAAVTGYGFKKMVQALRWRAECLQEASEGGANPVDTDKVAALLAAGDVLSVWSKTPVGGEGGVAAGSGEGDPPRQGRLVGQIVAAGLGVSARCARLDEIIFCVLLFGESVASELSPPAPSPPKS